MKCMLDWEEFNLEVLYGKSTRGKRLKSADRIPGSLPFVTAGEADEGVSDFIGNKVHVFPKNTTTIDMFGSAKYRNYEYGGDDHVAIVHTEKLPMRAAIFVTTAIHKLVVEEVVLYTDRKSKATIEVVSRNNQIIKNGDIGENE